MTKPGPPAFPPDPAPPPSDPAGQTPDSAPNSALRLGVVIGVIVAIVAAIIGLKLANQHRTSHASRTEEAGSVTTLVGAPVARRPAAAGDVDGDGLPDRVAVLPGPRAAGGGPTDDILQLRGTRAGLLTLDLGNSDQAVSALQAVDVNGDGRAEIPLEYSTPGVQARDELVAVTSHGLAVVTVNGRPLELLVGDRGGVTASWGCVDDHGAPGRPGSVETAVLAPAGGSYALIVTDYDLHGGVASQQKTATTHPDRAAGVTRVSALQLCGSHRPPR